MPLFTSSQYLCHLLAALKGVGVMPGIICFSFLDVLHPYNLNKSKTVSSHFLLGTCCYCPLEPSNIES